MRVKKNVALLLLTTSISISCASPTKFNDYQEGSWTVRAMVRDKQAMRSHIVHIDAVAKKPDMLRMDFSTPLGINLGYFILNGKKVSYYLARENKKQTLNASPRAMRPLINTDLDPHLLLDIFFDRAPEGKNWDCSKDANSYLIKCNESDKKISLEWLKRQNTQRAIELNTSSARIQLSLKGFKPKVQTDTKAFEL